MMQPSPHMEWEQRDTRTLAELIEPTPEVDAQASVLQATRAMAERQFGLVAVTSGRRVVGIFTERDLTRRVIAEERDPATTPIGSVMSDAVQSVTVTTPVSVAIQIMRSHAIRHLAVLGHDGELLGTVALRYLLYRLMDDAEKKIRNLECKADDLERYIMTDGPGG